ncbi:MAG: DMT family transporter [Chloroflexota bacterium]
MTGELAGLACAGAWAVISMILRGAAEHISPVAVNGLRCTFAAVTLAIIVALTGRIDALIALPIGVLTAIIISGVVGQAIGDALFIRSAKTVGASRALPISGISPLLTVALAAAFLGETPSPFGVLGAFFVLAGVYLLAFPYGRLKNTGDLISKADRTGVLFALAAAGCYSISTVVIRHGLVGADLVAANLARLVTASFMLMGLEVAQAGPRMPRGLSRRTLVIMVLTGALSAFSSLMYLTSVYYAGAGKAAILNSTSPLFGLPLSLVFLRERVTRRTLGGTLLSVAGIWLVIWQ